MSKIAPLEGYKKKCPVCKREFFADGSWAYKKTGRMNMRTYFCSWKCLRMAEKKKSREA